MIRPRHRSSGSVGTSTIMYSTISPREWAKRFMQREARRQVVAAHRKEREYYDEIRSRLKLDLMSKIYCTVCGQAMQRQDETAAEWSKIRKCPDCIAAGRRAGDSKHCRTCGKIFTRDQYLAKNHDYINAYPNFPVHKGWATWARCDDCSSFIKTVNELVEEEITRLQQKASV